MTHKHWLATLALAALGNTASAQGSVEIFGIMDLHINKAKSGPTSLTRMEDGGSAASRIGFRGSEDLGGGMRARFLLEAGVTPDTGMGTVPGPSLAFTRQSYLGLSAPWGHIELGRMYTPMFGALFRADPMGMNSLFSPTNLGYAIDAQPGLRPFAPRANNMLRYRSPESQKLLLDFAYSFGEVASPNSNNGRIVGGTVGWKQQPFFVGYSFQNAVEGSAAAPVASPRTSRFQTLVASWESLPVLRISGSYSTSSVNQPGTRDAHMTQLGADWSMTPADKLLFSIARRKVDGSNRSQTAWSLGYDHYLSKRTTLYARWLQSSNAGGSSVGIANVPVVANSGDGVRSIAIGARHNF
ncbi:porin [Comamonas composti]|uniref:porin n=1 Tax=Comamonas composti TaxID=408558 RepID=UPI0004131BEE|nr:porin [Comamonas composti]